MTKTIQTTMDFSDAMRAFQNGKLVQRKGWNGKGMFLFRTMGNSYRVTKGKLQSEIFGEGATVINNAHTDMRTADGSVCIGWLASQGDMEATDWIVVK